MKDLEQKISAVQVFKNRMRDAKAQLTGVASEKAILEAVVERWPEFDTIKNIGRWRNAWNVRVSDPELTEVVEKIADELTLKVVNNKMTRQRANRQLHRA